jgi:hypothetical protein
MITKLQFFKGKFITYSSINETSIVENVICYSVFGIWHDHKMQEGSARTETEARETCARFLVEYQQAQMT